MRKVAKCVSEKAHKYASPNLGWLVKREDEPEWMLLGILYDPESLVEMTTRQRTVIGGETI